MSTKAVIQACGPLPYGGKVHELAEFLREWFYENCDADLSRVDWFAVALTVR